MTYSKAKRDYNVQYIKDNIKRIPLDVQKDHHEKIKTAAATAGESVNGYIKRAIDERIERDGGSQKATGASVVAGTIHLPSDTIKTAQDAAQVLGEATEQFISRAIEAQAQEDTLIRLNAERQEKTTDALIREIDDTERLVTSTLWCNVAYNNKLYKKPTDAQKVRAALVECKQGIVVMLDNLIKNIGPTAK